MSSLADILGFDPTDPDARRAQLLASNDRALMRELIAIRKERGISQQSVGEMMGVSQPSVASFESHDSNPKLSSIRRYAHAVGALIRHTVALDEGQLLTDDVGWRTARIDATASVAPEASVMPPFPGAATRVARSSTAADFQLAA